MFPRLRQQLLARADLLLEFSTLGEYGVDEAGAIMQIEPDAPVSRRAARTRGCDAERVSSQACAMAPGHGLQARS